METTTDPGGRVDGRTARRDRNRLAVLDAVIELFADGDLAPDVHRVAARSGVSLRSVYRYFEDLDELIASAIERQLELLRPHFRIERIGEGPLDQRIERFVHRRVALYDVARTVYLAGIVRAGTDPRLRDELSRIEDVLAKQAVEMFSSEIDALGAEQGHHASIALDLLGQLGSLERLRHGVSLSTQETEAHLTACIRQVLTPQTVGAVAG